MNNIFSDEVRNAIYKRKKEINKTMIILSKLLKCYGMESYQHTVERLILAKETDDKFLEEHTVLDFIHGDLWLDVDALIFYGDILKGFIGEDEYKQFMNFIQSSEVLREAQNQALKLYQSKSIYGLLKTIWTERKYKDLLPNEVKVCIKWSLMELLSRTRLPKIYYYISNLPIRIKLNLTAKVIKYRLATQGYK